MGVGSPMPSGLMPARAARDAELVAPSYVLIGLSGSVGLAGARPLVRL